VKPASFEYHCPGSLDEALALLGEYGSDAKPLAGGQSLIPAMNFRLATPAVLVDLNAIATLAFVTRGEHDETLHIGAMTRQHVLERDPTIALHAPLLAQTLPFVAHPAIRTRGTIGGSLAHADPAAELPAVMLALNARFTLAARDHTRLVPADEFFVGLFSTALAPGELLTEVSVPSLPPRTGSAFQEVSRRHGDFALAGVAAVVSLDDAGRCATARVALLSVGDRPLLAASAASTLIGHPPSADVIGAAAHAVARHDIDPPSDIHASSRYRRHLIEVLTRRTLTEAFSRLKPEA
jgi:carbon-monoxide dehydrogenase medium subunit